MSSPLTDNAIQRVLGVPPYRPLRSGEPFTLQLRNTAPLKSTLAWHAAYVSDGTHYIENCVFKQLGPHFLDPFGNGVPCTQFTIFTVTKHRVDPIAAAADMDTPLGAILVITECTFLGNPGRLVGTPQPFQIQVPFPLMDTAPSNLHRDFTLSTGAVERIERVTVTQGESFTLQICNTKLSESLPPCWRVCVSDGRHATSDLIFGPAINHLFDPKIIPRYSVITITKHEVRRHDAGLGVFQYLFVEDIAVLGHPDFLIGHPYCQGSFPLTVHSTPSSSLGDASGGEQKTAQPAPSAPASPSPTTVDQPRAPFTWDPHEELQARGGLGGLFAGPIKMPSKKQLSPGAVVRIVGTSRSELNGTLCTVLSELDKDTFRHQVKTRVPGGPGKVLRLRPVNLSSAGDIKASLKLLRRLYKKFLLDSNRYFDPVLGYLRDSRRDELPHLIQTGRLVDLLKQALAVTPAAGHIKKDALAVLRGALKEALGDSKSAHSAFVSLQHRCDKSLSIRRKRGEHIDVDDEMMDTLLLAKSVRAKFIAREQARHSRGFDSNLVSGSASDHAYTQHLHAYMEATLPPTRDEKGLVLTYGLDVAPPEMLCSWAFWQRRVLEVADAKMLDACFLAMTRRHDLGPSLEDGEGLRSALLLRFGYVAWQKLVAEKMLTHEDSIARLRHLIDVTRSTHELVSDPQTAGIPYPEAQLAKLYAQRAMAQHLRGDALSFTAEDDYLRALRLSPSATCLFKYCMYKCNRNKNEVDTRLGKLTKACTVRGLLHRCRKLMLSKTVSKRLAFSAEHMHMLYDLQLLLCVEFGNNNQAKLDEYRRIVYDSGSSLGFSPEERMCSSGHRSTPFPECGDFDINTQSVCSFCGNVAATDDMFKCATCRIVWYCGEACQRAHWKKHEEACFALDKNKCVWTDPEDLRDGL